MDWWIGGLVDIQVWSFYGFTNMKSSPLFLDLSFIHSNSHSHTHTLFVSLSLHDSYKSNLSKNIENIPVIIRQVPGDGNCLFHSLSVALIFVEKKKHLQIKNRKAITSTRGGNDDVNIHSSCNGVYETMNKWKENRVDYGSSSSSISSDEEDIYKLYERSSMLRQIAVEMLSPIPTYHKQGMDDDDDIAHSNRNKRRYRRRKRRLLFLQGNEYLQREELLHIAASQYDLTGMEYCELMKKNGVWGGGPEIVALCNYLKRPIHVYELISTRPQKKKKGQTSKMDQQESSQLARKKNRRKIHRKSSSSVSSTLAKPEFRLRRMACFGSPKFDYKEPLHILSADCRFPDLKPGQEASNGNHFLAIFPVKKGDFRRSSQSSSDFQSSTKRRGFGVRSGASVDQNNSKDQKSQGQKVMNVESKHVWNRIRNRIGMIKNANIDSNSSKSRRQRGHLSTDDKSTAGCIVDDMLKKPYMSLMYHWMKKVAPYTS